MLGITEYYLVGFEFQGFHEAAGLRNTIPEALHEVSTRFCKSYGAALRRFQQSSTLSLRGFHENGLRGSPGPVGQVGARLHRQGPIGPRLRRRAPIGPHQLPSRYRLVLLDTLARPHPKQSRRSAIIWVAGVGGSPLAPRLHHRAPIGPRLRCRAPIGPRLCRRAPIGPRLCCRAPNRARLRCHS